MTTYSQIVKSSTIMGGSAAINLICSMMRVKFAAVFMGTTGVGLNASFSSIQNLTLAVAGVGIQSSSAKEVSAAQAADHGNKLSSVVYTTRILCFTTGMIGMFVTFLLGEWVSVIMFDNTDYSLHVSALGMSVLLHNISNGQVAIIQGMRRIDYIAIISIASGLLSTIAALGFYMVLGLNGIVPAIITSSALQLAVTSFYYGKLGIPPLTHMSLHEIFAESKSMLSLGLILMLTGLMSTLVGYFTILLTNHAEGIHSVGLYSAAFALSGIFVNFILTAMGTDYYPRLVFTLGKKSSMTDVINEQTEIGLLLAAPGIIATMAMAPWILSIFYTDEFSTAKEMLQWFLIGCLGRVISWPMGYTLPALGKKKWLIISETLTHGLHIVIIYIGLQLYGVIGVAYAFAIIHVLHAIAMRILVGRLINFSWSKNALCILLCVIFACTATLTLSITLDDGWTFMVACSITLATAITSIFIILQKSGVRTKPNFLSRCSKEPKR